MPRRVTVLPTKAFTPFAFHHSHVRRARDLERMQDAAFINQLAQGGTMGIHLYLSQHPDPRKRGRARGSS